MKVISQSKGPGGIPYEYGTLYYRPEGYNITRRSPCSIKQFPLPDYRGSKDTTIKISLGTNDDGMEKPGNV